MFNGSLFNILYIIDVLPLKFENVFLIYKGFIIYFPARYKDLPSNCSIYIFREVLVGFINYIKTILSITIEKPFHPSTVKIKFKV